MSAVMVPGGAFAAVQFTVERESCFEKAQDVYVVRGPAVEVEGGQWALEVVSTVKGDDRKAVRVASERMAIRHGRAIYFTKGDLMVCHAWSETTFWEGGSTIQEPGVRVPIAQHLEYFEAWETLKSDGSPGNVGRALAEFGIGGRQAAVRFLQHVDNADTPELQGSWDALGPHLIRAFREDVGRVDRQLYIARMELLARAVWNSKAWRSEAGMEPASWWADAEKMLTIHVLGNGGVVRHHVRRALGALGSRLEYDKGHGGSGRLDSRTLRRLRDRSGLVGPVEVPWWVPPADDEPKDGGGK